MMEFQDSHSLDDIHECRQYKLIIRKLPQQLIIHSCHLAPEF